MNDTTMPLTQPQPDSKSDGIPRSNPLVPLAMSAKALSDPTLKASGKYKRALMKSRGREVLRPKAERVAPAVKMFRRLKSFTLAQLIRRKHQFARRASTAMHMLMGLEPTSSFRPPLENSQRINLHFLDQTVAEIKVRLNPELARA